jgi:hypothetical protein
MNKTKYITEELINERLEAKGFGDKQTENDDIARTNVLKHYGVDLIDTWTNKAEFYIYEETTKDGYAVYVATHDADNISICEDVYYSDSDLGNVLVNAIKDSNGDEDYPDVIYVDDLYQDFIDQAIESLFIYLSVKFEEEIVAELIDEGYVQPELVTD